MISIALLAASLLIGPEHPVPAAIDEPVKADLRCCIWQTSDMATIGHDFVFVWSSTGAIWSQQIDGNSGAPLAPTASRVALASDVYPLQPRVASNGTTTVVILHAREKGSKSSNDSLWLYAATLRRDGSAGEPRIIGRS